MPASRRCPAEPCRFVAHGFDLAAVYDAVGWHIEREHGRRGWLKQ